MQRSLKTLALLLALGGLAPQIQAFSLAGTRTGSPWMTANLGYVDLPGDIPGVGPMKITAFYRWNVPTLTYAFDESFIRFFGTNGIKAVDDAFAVLNGLPAASQINLDDYATDTKMANLQAAQAGLMDLKSTTLSILVRHLGLAAPERYVWTLRYGGNYPFVLNRNFDPYTYFPSPYVNSALYSYRILDDGAGNLDAVEDPITTDNNLLYSSVAGGYLNPGDFYAGLTRDDVGGLKYLLNTNTLAIEGVAGGVSGNVLFGFAFGWVPWFGNNSGTNNAFTLTTNQSYFVTQNQLTALLSGTNFVATGIRGGIEKVTFQKVQFDSLIGLGFYALTNTYTDSVILTNKLISQHVQRSIGYPDIVFVAEDLPYDPNTGTLTMTSYSTDDTFFHNNDAANGLATDGGPGTIYPAGWPIAPAIPPTRPAAAAGSFVRISFTTLVGLVNHTPYFMNELGATRTMRWASFDHTPTPPVIYPVSSQLNIGDLLNAIANTPPVTFPQR